MMVEKQEESFIRMCVVSFTCPSVVSLNYSTVAFCWRFRCIQLSIQLIEASQSSWFHHTANYPSSTLHQNSSVLIQWCWYFQWNSGCTSRSATTSGRCERSNRRLLWSLLAYNYRLVVVRLEEMDVEGEERFSVGFMCVRERDRWKICKS